MPGNSEVGRPLEQLQVLPLSTGELSAVPPTFLERWGVVLLACFGAWVLVFAGILLAYYLVHLPAMPPETGQSADQLKASLDEHRIVLDQYRESITYVFDLMVTRTVLPLITLLLGYLFGKTRNA